MKPYRFPLLPFKEMLCNFLLRKEILSSDDLFLMSVFAGTMLEGNNHQFTQFYFFSLVWMQQIYPMRRESFELICAGLLLFILSGRTP